MQPKTVFSNKKINLKTLLSHFGADEGKSVIINHKIDAGFVINQHWMFSHDWGIKYIFDQRRLSEDKSILCSVNFLKQKNLNSRNTNVHLLTKWNCSLFVSYMSCDTDMETKHHTGLNAAVQKTYTKKKKEICVSYRNKRDHNCGN